MIKIASFGIKNLDSVKVKKKLSNYLIQGQEPSRIINDFIFKWIRFFDNFFSSDRAIEASSTVVDSQEFDDSIKPLKLKVYGSF